VKYFIPRNMSGADDAEEAKAPVRFKRKAAGNKLGAVLVQEEEKPLPLVPVYSDTMLKKGKFNFFLAFGG
jgi:hypothetical protein